MRKATSAEIILSVALIAVATALSWIIINLFFSTLPPPNVWARLGKAIPAGLVLGAMFNSATSGIRGIFWPAAPGVNNPFNLQAVYGLIGLFLFAISGSVMITFY